MTLASGVALADGAGGAGPLRSPARVAVLEPEPVRSETVAVAAISLSIRLAAARPERLAGRGRRGFDAESTNGTSTPAQDGTAGGVSVAASGSGSNSSAIVGGGGGGGEPARPSVVGHLGLQRRRRWRGPVAERNGRHLLEQRGRLDCRRWRRRGGYSVNNSTTSVIANGGAGGAGVARTGSNQTFSNAGSIVGGSGGGGG